MSAAPIPPPLPSLNGLLVVDKPAGWTSHDVVAKVRRILGEKRIGHTGTLDPFATGVLPLCIGPSTRLATWLALEDKVYEATLRLGQTTATLDNEGPVLQERPVPSELSVSQIEAVLARFRGEVLQVPPMYSALKVQGKPLHAYARAGQEIAREARPVQIFALQQEPWEAPFLRLRVHCSKGTYVRVLAADIGEALGCGAHLVALRRARTGAFGLEQALTLPQLEAAPRDALRSLLLPALDVLPQLSVLSLPPDVSDRVRHGTPILRRTLRRVEGIVPPEGLVRLVLGNELVAVGEVNTAAPPGPNEEVIRIKAVLAAQD